MLACVCTCMYVYVFLQSCYSVCMCRFDYCSSFLVSVSILILSRNGNVPSGVLYYLLAGCCSSQL